MKAQIIFEAQKQLAVCRLQLIEANRDKAEGRLTHHDWQKDVCYFQGKEHAISNLVSRIVPEEIFLELHNEKVIAGMGSMVRGVWHDVYSITPESYEAYCQEVEKAKTSMITPAATFEK